MPKTIIKIHTWTCPHCDYHQDFDPNNVELVAKHFPRVFVMHEIKGEPVETGTFNAEGEPIMKIPVTYEKEVGFCPACFLGQNPEKKRLGVKMVRETNSAKKCTLIVMGEEEVETLETMDYEPGPERKPIKRKLTSEEKQAKKIEIRAAVIKAKALEDK